MDDGLPAPPPARGTSQGVPTHAERRPLFTRLALPELASAAVCALLLLPPLARSEWARGMADVVAAMGILAFFELPLVVFLVALTSKGLRPGQARTLVLSIYGALALAFAFVGGWKDGLSLRFVFLLALPMAMRGIAFANHLEERGSMVPPFVVAMGSLVSWVFCLFLIALPLAALLGPELPAGASKAREMEPNALNAMGIVYFVIVGILRWRMAVQFSRPGEA